MNINTYKSYLISVVSGILIACGGGSDTIEQQTPTPTPTPTPGDPVALSLDEQRARLEGRWTQQCPIEIDYGNNSYGPEAGRERLELVGPDASGQIELTIYTDIFANTIGCGDTTTKPYATVKWGAPIKLKFSHLIDTIDPGTVDVYTAIADAAPVVVAGSGATLLPNGNWSIGFASGHTVVIEGSTTPEHGELSFNSYKVNTDTFYNELIFNNYQLGESGRFWRDAP